MQHETLCLTEVVRKTLEIRLPCGDWLVRAEGLYAQLCGFWNCHKS